MEVLIQKGQGKGRTFQNLGGTIFFARKGDKPVKGVDVEMGGREVLLFFYYFTVPFSHIYPVWGESMVSLYYFSDLQSLELALQDFHPCSHSSLVRKPGLICAFLVVLQKILTALFNLI